MSLYSSIGAVSNLLEIKLSLLSEYLFTIEIASVLFTLIIVNHYRNNRKEANSLRKYINEDYIPIETLKTDNIFRNKRLKNKLENRFTLSYNEDLYINNELINDDLYLKPEKIKINIIDNYDIKEINYSHFENDVKKDHLMINNEIKDIEKISYVEKDEHPIQNIRHTKINYGCKVNVHDVFQGLEISDDKDSFTPITRNQSENRYWSDSKFSNPKIDTVYDNFSSSHIDLICQVSSVKEETIKELRQTLSNLLNRYTSITWTKLSLEIYLSRQGVITLLYELVKSGTINGAQNSITDEDLWDGLHSTQINETKWWGSLNQINLLQEIKNKYGHVQNICPKCNGTGRIRKELETKRKRKTKLFRFVTCDTCNGDKTFKWLSLYQRSSNVITKEEQKDLRNLLDQYIADVSIIRRNETETQIRRYGDRGHHMIIEYLYNLEENEQRKIIYLIGRLSLTEAIPHFEDIYGDSSENNKDSILNSLININDEKCIPLLEIIAQSNNLKRKIIANEYLSKNA